MMNEDLNSPEEKALKLNLDRSIYGTFAESVQGSDAKMPNTRKGYCSASFGEATSSPLLFLISGRFTILEQYYNCRESCTLF